MSLPRVKVIYDYKTLLLACWSYRSPVIYISSNIPISLRILKSSSLHNPFPVMFLCHPWYCISFCCPSIGGSLVGKVSYCCISECWLLAVSRHEISVGLSSASIMHATRFDLVFFDAWLVVVYLTSIVFGFSLLFRVSTPPNGQVVVLWGSSLPYLLLVLMLCLPLHFL